MKTYPDLIDQYNVYRKDKTIITKTKQVRKIKSKTITEKDLKHHVEGKTTIAFRYQYFTNLFSLDLDKPKNEREQLTFFDSKSNISALYQIVISKLGIPSLVYQSHETGGLHCYYKLTERYPFELVKIYLNALFGKLRNVEILPTPRRLLRFVFDKRNGGNILEPQTLKVIKVMQGNEYLQMKNRTKEAPEHRVEELFNDNLLNRYREHIFSFSARTRRRNADQNIRFLKYHQKYLSTLKNGTTNEYIADICFNGYCNQVAKEIIVEQVIQDFQTRYIVIDRDTTPKRIRERVLSHYRRLAKQNILLENRKRKQTEYEAKLLKKVYPIIKKIIAKIGIKFIGDPKNQRKEDVTKKSRSLKNYLYELLRWKEYILGLSIDECLMMETQYQYFYHRVKRRKLIPIPTAIIEKWYKRYHIVMPILINHHLITIDVKYYNPYIEKQYNQSLIGHSQLY